MCVLTNDHPGAAEGCHAKFSADSVNGSGGSCATCLINERGTGFKNCPSKAISTEDAEMCVTNASFSSCRDNCYVQCVLNGAVPSPNILPEDPITPTVPQDPVTTEEGKNRYEE